ncbi:MAG: peptidoglycan editing factor PgeF [Chromatiales bacterium]|nr:peptidoglycan editing factor PgeF [Chromatiales bacterium]
MNTSFITPEWPAPANIRSVMTTRLGGVSRRPYDSLNLGGHVGDVSTAVDANRQMITEQLHLPTQPKWLHQIHSATALNSTSSECEGDACFSHRVGDVCAVMTADCLPLLVCNRKGTEIAAIHAGWRGLLAGVIESTINALDASPNELMVWLGAAIGPNQFEVGSEVRQQFVDEDKRALNAFKPSANTEHWLADIYQLARIRLNRLGVRAIYGGGLCTYSDSERFFSYRRDGVTGRMGSLIWME